MRLPHYEPNKVNSIIEDFIWIDACLHLAHVGGVIYVMGIGYAAIHLWAKREGKGGGSVIHFVADKVWELECRAVARWKGVPCDK